MLDIPSYLLGKVAGNKKGLKVEVVEELPQTGQDDILYLLPKETTGDNDIFEEWLYVDNAWEMIGTTDIDLSDYQPLIDSNNKLASDLVDDSSSTNKFVTASDKTTWNNKSDFSGSYDDLTNKPTIPTVPTNVSAFTNDAGYLTSHQDISGKENTSNKVTSVDTNSTDTQYPSAKLLYDKTKDILHYKGHVNSENLLPDTGQPSGTRYGEICKPRAEVYNDMLKPSDNSTLLNYRSYKDYFLIFDNMGGNSFYDGVIFATDYPEQISVFFPRTWNNTTTHTLGIAVKYDANKPVYYRTYGNYSSYLIQYDKESGTIGSLTKTTSDWVLIDESMNFARTTYERNNFTLEYQTSFTRIRIANNIPKLKFKKMTFNHLFTGVGTPAEADTFTNVADTYYYNEDMAISICPDGNYQNTKYATNETSVEKNDVYTVGNDNDIYRVNDNVQWEQWSKQLDLTTIADYDATTTQTLKNVNGIIKWVDDE